MKAVMTYHGPNPQAVFHETVFAMACEHSGYYLHHGSGFELQRYGYSGFSYLTDDGGWAACIWETSACNKMRLEYTPSDDDGNDRLVVKVEGRRHGIPWDFLHLPATSSLCVVAYETRTPAVFPWYTGDGKSNRLPKSSYEDDGYGIGRYLRLYRRALDKDMYDGPYRRYGANKQFNDLLRGSMLAARSARRVK